MLNEQADSYLTLPPSYAHALGGLRWSHGCDAIETEAGLTVTLNIQLELLLEGFFKNGRVYPFGYLLSGYMLCKLKFGLISDTWSADLRETFQRAGLVGQGFNCGVFLAELCNGLPTISNPPKLADVKSNLARRTLFGERHRPGLILEPPIDPKQLREHFKKKLSTLSKADLEHWFKFGTGPTRAGEVLAEQTESFPQRLAELDRTFKQRERLIGAVGLVPALDAVLSLPPRRPTPDRLPQGGYADVTTRGQPDRLLPSQFALEADEFIRRFAENELLYFEREQPQKPHAPDRWLVLDQGIRTWGRTRLALVGAVIALLRKEPEKYGQLKLVTTLRAEPMDPHLLSPNVLADELEASDLTYDPSRALEAAFEVEPGELPRDVILFTHPRALADTDVLLSFSMLESSGRLFVLSVDESGQAELSHWSKAGLVGLRKFRLDLDTAEAAKLPETETVELPATPFVPWKGDVEPVPFPYQAGLVADVHSLMAFDSDDTHLLLANENSCPQLLCLDGSNRLEVLPRPYLEKRLLKGVFGVVGVRNGFVLFCSWTSYATSSPLFVVHYNLPTRTVSVKKICDGLRLPAYFYSWPDLDCVGYCFLNDSQTHAFTYDLQLGLSSSVLQNSDTFQAAEVRTRTACTRMIKEQPQPCTVALATRREAPHQEAYCQLVQDTLIFSGMSSQKQWTTVRPVEEGVPVFKDALLSRVTVSQNLMAIRLTRSSKKSSTRLLVVHGPDNSIRFQQDIRSSHEFEFSASSHLLAIQTDRRAVQVRRLNTGDNEVIAQIGNSGYHNNTAIQLEAHGLQLWIGSHQHHFSWHDGTWTHRLMKTMGTPPQEKRTWPGIRTVTDYDADRFGDCVAGWKIVAAVDQLGQIVLMHGGTGELLLTVLVRRDLAAAYLPDGTRWAAAKSGVLIGSGSDPNAAKKIGQLLRKVTSDS